MLYGEKLNVDECFGLIKSKYTSTGITHEEADISLLHPEGKSAVILCGNNTKNAKKASAYATYYINWIKEHMGTEDITVYSVYYPHTQPLNNALMVNTRFNYEGLAKILFKQAIYNDGNVRSADEVASSMDDIMFFGHSVGGFVMNQLMNMLGGMLYEQKFSEDDIKNIYSRIVFMGYSPFALVEAPINAIYIAPIYDSVGSTKLAIEKMNECKDFVSSVPKLQISKIYKNIDKPYADFMVKYQKAIDNQDTVYFANANTLIATPNLLFFDGIKEDHNLAGVIKYSYDNTYKTNAGEITTQLIQQTLKYVLSVERQNFSIAQLYNEVVTNEQQYINTGATKER